MQTQGPAFNHDYFVQLTAEINNINVCAELQELSNEVSAMLQAEIDGIEAQIQLLIPLQVLVQIPTNLNQVISWISNMITGFLQPYLKPYIIYIEQLAQMATDIANLAAAIEAAAQRLENCNVTFTAPVITAPALPTIQIAGVPAGQSPSVTVS